MNVTLVNISSITSAFYLQVYFYFIRVWCVTLWTLSVNVLHTPIRCMHPFGKKREHSASVCSYYPKYYSNWIIHDMIISNVCISRDDVLNTFRVLFLCQFGSVIYMFCKVPTSLWSLVDVLIVIYIVFRFNHVSMVTNSPFDGLGWRFPDIFSQAIILFEPFLHQYT